MIGAVMLAAGESRRMGRPKMALPWQDTTVIGQVVRTLASAGVEEIIVVTGGDRDAVDAALQDLPARPVFNPDHQEGEMLSTFKTGLAALSEGVEAALIVLGDQPQIEGWVVKSVISAYHSSGAALVVPSFNRRRGHPWLLDRSLWQEALALPPPATLRDFLNLNAGKIHYLLVDTGSILLDLDTPEDYSSYQRPTH
jgi:molybdenum cofactor cytidylyltransferase